MHRVLIDLGPLQIGSYGFVLAVSFLLGIYLAARRAPGFGLKPEQIVDVSLVIVLTAAVGSRLLYVIFHWGQYAHPGEILAVWRGGATFYGGFLLSLAASAWWTRRKHLDFLAVADVIAPSVALGLMLARVGCLLSGCCFGTPTSHAWGLEFPADSPAGAAAAVMAARMGVDQVALHPTQVYSSIKGLLILVALLGLKPRLGARGATFGLLLVLYGGGRFVIDFFRYYEEGGRVLGGLTVSQAISVGLLVAGLVLLLKGRPAPAFGASGRNPS